MDLTRLYEVQVVDLQIDQARHALDHLVERRVHLERQRELAHIRSIRGDILRELQIQEAELTTIEAESAQVDTKRRRLEDQLKSIISPREAEALQHEIATLNAKRSDLDDRGLALLDGAARAEGELTVVTGRENEAARAVTDAQDDMDRATVGLQHEIERLDLLRQDVISRVDTADLAEYERRRAVLGGIAVATITHGVCGGCHMDISISELDAIKRLPEDVAAECPNCNRLLVR